MTNISPVTHWGQGKSRSRSLAPISEQIPDHLGLFKDVEANTFQKMYGQDGIAWLFRDKVKLYANADGHGIHGEEHAKYALRLLPSRILERVPEIQRLYKQKKYQEIKELLETIYSTLDTYINFECAYTNSLCSGGCTMTTKLLIPHPSQPWKYVSITSNTGDSISAVVQSGTHRMFEETTELNADSFEAWSEYAQNCHTQGYSPKLTVLSRFNVTNRSTQIGWAQPPVDGINQPIKPFKYKTVDGQLVPEHNDEVMRNFYTKAPPNLQYIITNGGTQSYRGRQPNLDEQNDGLFPAHNFGCTLEGLVQCLPSFGDLETRLTPSTTSNKMGEKHPEPEKLMVKTNIRTIHKSEIFLMGTDGLFDVLTNQDIIQATKNVESTKHNPTPLDYQTEYIKTMDKVSKTIFSVGKYLMFPRSPTGDIAWDDVSCITGKVIIVQPKQKRNTKGKGHGGGRGKGQGRGKRR